MRANSAIATPSSRLASIRLTANPLLVGTPHSAARFGLWFCRPALPVIGANSSPLKPFLVSPDNLLTRREPDRPEGGSRSGVHPTDSRPACSSLRPEPVRRVLHRATRVL